MTAPWRIENIEKKRQEVGIDDVELHQHIKRLDVGDIVHLTLLTSDGRVSENVEVRITAIKGATFHGLLMKAPRATALGLAVGQTMAFLADHVHSVPGKTPREPERAYAATKPASAASNRVARGHTS